MNEDTLPTVTMETGTLICAHCGKELMPLLIDEIEDTRQLRVGAILISSIEGNCMKCGWKFIWKIREKDVKEMTLIYSKLLNKLTGYQPE